MQTRYVEKTLRDQYATTVAAAQLALVAGDRLRAICLWSEARALAWTGRELGNAGVYAVWKSRWEQAGRQVAALATAIDAGKLPADVAS